MGYRLRKLLEGINGFDTLARLSLGVSVLVVLIGVFLPPPWLRYMFYILGALGVVYAYMRCFSKNVVRRQRENAAFVEFFKIQRLRIKERKSYRYVRCPACRAWLRIPRGIGDITVKCRVCEKKFDKRS